MPYLGVAPNPRENREVDDISSSFNGSTTAFTLQSGGSNVSPGKDTAIIVSLGGVVQNPGTDYTIAASTITFTTAPASGLSFFGVVLAQSIDIETTADNTVTTAKIVNDAVTADKLAHTAVTAGSYTTADITVDAQGRITSAASGTISGAEIADQAVTNAKVNNSAAIAGTKISPDFGSQNIATGGDVTITSATPTLKLMDSSANPDYSVSNNNGVYRIRDLTNLTNPFLISTSEISLDRDLSIPDTIVHTSDTNTKIRFPANDTISFETSGSERVRVDSSGKMGIGTASPDDTLVLSGSTGHGLKLIDGTHIGVLRTFSGGAILKTASNHPLTFGTNDTERMRISSNGNLLINATTEIGGSGAGIQIGHPTDATLFLGSAAATVGNNAKIVFGPASNFSTSQIVGYAVEDGSSSANGTGGLKFFVRKDGNFNEAIRITEFGNVQLAEAVTSHVAKLDVSHSGNNGGAGVVTYVSRLHQNSNNTGTDHACVQLRSQGALSGQDAIAIDFRNSGNATVGKVRIGQSTTGYDTSSDYRLKENIVTLSDGITRLKQLAPKRFNFISDTTNTVIDGFIAHEVSPVIPEAVSGVKDATCISYYDANDDIPEGKSIGDVKNENEIDPQGLDYAKLTPLLTAALQEAIAKIETLETKVAALEAA